MNKITPEIKAGLQIIAGNLPVVMEETHEVHIMTGRELKEIDIVKDAEGKDLVDNKKYDWPFPVQVAWNHYRRMKSAYKKHGEPGIMDYINRVGDIKDKNEAA